MSGGKIGVIGGSGLYAMAGLEHVSEVQVETPFGPPSDAFIVGTLHGRDMVFLPRHGRGHRQPPSALNFRANIYGLKSLGVEWVISVSAVGSMREDIHPGDVVIPDQFVDRTRSRVSTFFDRDIVVHIAFADPVCQVLAQTLYQAASPSVTRRTYSPEASPARFQIPSAVARPSAARSRCPGASPRCNSSMPQRRELAGRAGRRSNRRVTALRSWMG